MKVCLGTMHADGKGQEPQARRTRLVGWNGILARREGLLEAAVRCALSVSVCWRARDPERRTAGVSPARGPAPR